MVLVGLGVSACASDDDSDSAADFAPGIEAEPPTGEMPEPGRSGTVELTESAGDAAVEQAPGAPLPTGQALATTAGVVVATSDIRAAVADTLATVQRNGASVFTADVKIGDEREDGSIDGSGFFVVKVPPADLEPLITDLGATVGRLSGRTQDTTDVTDQLVDLDIRIGVERDVIARFQNLLVDATEFQDIVEIERVISERTIALEQLLASQRNLDNRVDRSTLTIQLQYESPRRRDRRNRRRLDREHRRRMASGLGRVRRRPVRHRFRAGSGGAVHPHRSARARGDLVGDASPPTHRSQRQPPRWRHRDGGRRAGHAGRAARRAQPSGVSTRSLTLPSGKAKGARTPACARTSGSVSGPKPVV